MPYDTSGILFEEADALGLRFVLCRGGRPTLQALVVAGKIVVQDDQIPGVDLVELGRQARAAIRSLLVQH